MSSNMVSDTMKTVSIARNIKRPTAREFIDQLFDEFMEFHNAGSSFANSGITLRIRAFMCAYSVRKNSTRSRRAACLMDGGLQVLKSKH